MINQIIKTMKERLPNDPRTKSYFDKIVADGFTEEQAKDIMITAWLNKINGDWMTENKRINLAKNHTNGPKTAKTIIEAIQWANYNNSYMIN